MCTQSKELYETPGTEVLELKMEGALLTLSDPNDYPGGGNPFASPMF